MRTLVAGIALAGFTYGVVESRWIRPVTHEVELAGLDPVFNGFTILHLSDLHGRVEVFSLPLFRRWLKSADLVVVTGDLYHPGLSRRRLARALDGVRQRRPTFLVSGNHDYRSGRLDLRPLSADGLLDNSVVPIRRSGHIWWLAGLPDLVAGRPDWGPVLSQIGSGAAVLLSHRPDAVVDPRAKRFQLILSGHTHGGQVVFPVVGALVKHTRVGGGYVAGRRDIPDGPTLITSRGLGTSELPVRLFCRPELVRVVLRAPVDVGSPAGERQQGQGLA